MFLLILLQFTQMSYRFAATLLAACFVAGAQEPTLTETTDWLATHLNGYRSVSHGDDNPKDRSSMQWGATSITFRGCDGRATASYQSSSSSYFENTDHWVFMKVEQTGMLTFSLRSLLMPIRPKEIGSLRVEGFTEKTPTKWAIVLSASGALEGTSTLTSSSANSPEKKETERSSTQPGGILFYFDDADMLGRVVRALTRAGQLCGAKGEPF